MSECWCQCSTDIVGGERCFLVVVVDMVVVVSMKVVDISGGMAVLRADPEAGTSPTRRTLPLMRMLGLP